MTKVHPKFREFFGVEPKSESVRLVYDIFCGIMRRYIEKSKLTSSGLIYSAIDDGPGESIQILEASGLLKIVRDESDAGLGPTGICYAVTPTQKGHDLFDLCCA